MATCILQTWDAQEGGTNSEFARSTGEEKKTIVREANDAVKKEKASEIRA